MEQDEILNFWENLHLYTSTEMIKEKALKYYTDDFINNYSKWTENVAYINNEIKSHLESLNFPIKYWEPITYDGFCKHINDLMQEWITANNGIIPEDILIIQEKMLTDNIAKAITNFQSQAYSINNVLDSIKIAIIN